MAKFVIKKYGDSDQYLAPYIKNYMARLATAYINNAVDIFIKEAKKCITLFYESYPNPSVYVRTNNLKKHSVHLDYKKNNGKGNVSASVSISTIDMFDNYGNFASGLPKTNYVTRITWMEGVHGMKSVGYIMNPSPYKLLEQYYNSQKYSEEALEIAKKEVYDTSTSVLRMK